MASLEKVIKARILRRDHLSEKARALRRASQDFMRRIHAEWGPDRLPHESERGFASAHKRLTEIARPLLLELEGEGWREESLVEDAIQEWVEANLLLSVVEGRPLVSPGSLGVPAEAYLLGLSDLVGEVRRLAVTALGRGDVARAKGLLVVMDNLAATLMRFDIPRSILPIKPKQDAARSLVERTRGDVELASFLDGAARRSRKVGI